MSTPLLDITIPNFELKAKQTKLNVWSKTKLGKRYMGRKTPEDVRTNAEILGALLAEHRPKEPYGGPLEMHLICEYGRKGAVSSVHIRLFPLASGKPTRPDCDNLSKQACDVLQQMGFFHDDAQIARLIVEKLEVRP